MVIPKIREGISMKLVKTGIAGLDEFLTGGLPPKVLLLSGLPGAGNEIFAREVAYTRSKQVGITYFTVNATSHSTDNNTRLARVCIRASGSLKRSVSNHGRPDSRNSSTSIRHLHE